MSDIKCPKHTTGGGPCYCLEIDNENAINTKRPLRSSKAPVVSRAELLRDEAGGTGGRDFKKMGIKKDEKSVLHGQESEAVVSRTIAEVKQQNDSIGHYWFSEPTMRFFNTEILSQELYKDRYFITRERMDETDPWQYAVRCAHPNGKVETAASKFESATTARRRMRALARENGYA